MKKIFIGIAIFTIAVSFISAETSRNSSAKNDKATFEKYKKSADQNNSESIYNLGVLYANGTGVKKDMQMAHKLFLKSANMGYARAQYNMGVMYLKGISVKQDNSKAFKWFELTAIQNMPEGLYTMGMLYEEGKGVRKNIKKAQYYYVRGSDLGDKRSIMQSKKYPLLKKGLEFQDKSWNERKKKNYMSAAKNCKQALAIRIQIFGIKNRTNIRCYNRLGQIYSELGNIQASIKYYKKALSIAEEIFGRQHKITKQYYKVIGSYYEKIKNYPKSLEYYRNELGDNNPELSKAYGNVSQIYLLEGNYIAALKYSQEALTTLRKAYGDNHLDVSTAYYTLSMIYFSLRNYSKALEYEKKAFTIDEKMWGYKNINMIQSCATMAVIYERLRDHSNAVIYSKKVLEIEKNISENKRVYMSNNNKTFIADSYVRIATYYYNNGDFQKALINNKKALMLYKKIYGSEHPFIATAYNNTGEILQKIGAYDEAFKYHKKALQMREIIFGKEHIATANSYHNLGLLCMSMGNYRKALDYMKRAISIRETILGKEHIDTVVSYSNIGVLYKMLGDYSKAMSFYRKVLKIREKELGENSTETAQIYNNIGVLYQKMGNFSKAWYYHNKSMSIREKVLGSNNVYTAESYNNIGGLYNSVEEYSKALLYFKKAMEIEREVLGQEHPKIAITYNNIASIYSDKDDYSKALKYYQKALAIDKKILGKGHINISIRYSNISNLYLKQNNYPQSHHYAQLAFNNFLTNRDKVFTILDSKQKEKYLKSNSGYITLLLKSSYAYMKQLKKEKQPKKAQTILQSGANAWLNYKGSVFDSENAIAMLYSSTKDKKLKVKIDDLVSSKRYLARLYQSLPKPKEKEAWKSNIKKTEDKIAKITNQIASKATNFKEQQGLKSIGYQDITSHLKDNELYIDYAKVGGHYYLFSLDHQENISFIQIDKNSTKKIDKLVKEFKEDINTVLDSKDLTDKKLKALTESSKEKLFQLYDLVIKKPLGEAIKDKTSLIISPDGALRLLPFEALFDKENNRYFIEEKEIRYIPSGKELVRLYKYSKDKVSKAKKSTVIFANPNFDTKIASTSKEEIAITPNTNRSGIIKSLFRMRFAALPGTKSEAKAIKATLNKKTIQEYQNNKATENNLMKVKEPRILHIATHGFFINDNTIPNPMLKSGIALAGANASAIKGKSDGIVTALKLSGLDLKGTDLVVLSACQTGVVDINSTDSVSGLSKAFIQAGAKDIVMSLWSVDDQATKELMSSFYTEMKENKSYAKALKAAKLKMIAEGRHPFYWGAFVVSGL